MFGLAFFWEIHSVWYLVLIQILSGIFQTTGWPGRHFLAIGFLPVIFFLGFAATAVLDTV
jgi:hypothetical protein